MGTLQSPITGVWDYDSESIEFRMPWYGNHVAGGNAYISTDGNGGWWGTLITENWTPVAPWIGNISPIGEATARDPNAIWYWVR
jgi:hypothetical protein